MAMLVQNISGHIQTQLTRSLEKIFDDANQSGELKLSNRKLKDFPKGSEKYNLSDTVIADLSKNRFSELPEEVTTFHFLEALHCYHNTIRSLPDTVVNLQCLIFLDLSRNQLTSLPRELCHLPIKILLVSNNNLAYLPDELSRMSQLTELDASSNQLTHLPPRLNELKHLESLVLRSNLLLAVPIEVTYLRLVRLDLRANRIAMLPLEVRFMATLMELLIEENPLTCPPASLCKRGRVHIYKYLENEAAKYDKRTGGTTATLGRRSKKGASSSPGPPLLSDRLKHKRHNVDSGYSTSSDGFDKRWSQEITGDPEKNWASAAALSRSEVTSSSQSMLSTPSTISPAPELNCDDYDRQDGDSKMYNKEYKEALKQQRAHDVPSVYRTKESDDQSYNKTEPNTPTHHASAYSSLATSKSDPTPLNAALSGSKSVFDDTKDRGPLSPYRGSPTHLHHNGNTVDAAKHLHNSRQHIHDYVKPKSPVKGRTGILSHDNVPPCNTNGTVGKAMGSPRGSPDGYMNGSGDLQGMNGVKTSRSISWNKDVSSMEKMTFTMRREIDKAREETDLINQLRNIIETRLKMTLPENLAPALTDGVVLCHLANHIKPRSVASIHVPSPAVPKLTMARCRRNVDNFIEACRKIGVDEGLLCSTLDVTEALAGRGLPRLLDTVVALCEFDPAKAEFDGGLSELPKPPPTWHDTTVSLLLLVAFLATVAFFAVFPPPN